MVKPNLVPEDNRVLPPVNGDAPWVLELMRGTHKRRACFLWNRDFLVNAFAESKLPPMRSAEKPSKGVVVLADIFVFDRDSFVIEAQLLQSGPNRQALQMRLLAPNKADANPRVILRWGTKQYTTTFRGGQATIDNLLPLQANHKYPNDPPPEFSLSLDFDGGADPLDKNG